MGSSPGTQARAAPHRSARGSTLGWMGVAAVLTVVGFDPPGWAPAGWLALAPWCLLARAASRPRRAFGAGYLTGLAVLGCGCFWLTRAHPVNLIGMALVEALFFGLLPVLLRAAHRWVPFWLAAPIVFVGIEWLRASFPLDGYPWLLLGYTQASWDLFVQAADLAGVWGISFLLALTGGLLAETWIYSRGERRWGRRWLLTGWGVTGVVLAATLLYGDLRRSGLDPGPRGPQLVAVQANIPQQLKRNRTSPREIYRRHVELTRQGVGTLAAGSPWPPIVVWPETMFPVELAADASPDGGWARDVPPKTREEADEIERELVVENLIEPLLAPHQAWLVLGVPTLAGSAGRVDRRYNSAILYRPDGTRAGIYHKTILVPGGEYLPFVDWLPFSDTLRGLVRSIADFVPDLSPGAGIEPVDLELPAGRLRLGISICYENIYARHARSLVRQGADFLINLSNEAWFEDSSEMDQMHAMSVFRAVETRRALLRCTNSGVTALYQPSGRSQRLIVDGADREVAGVLTGRPSLCRVTSLYVRWGDWLAWLAALGCGVLILAELLRAWLVTSQQPAPL